MNKKALSLAICVALALPTVSSALSLGEIQSNSSLNQPFRGQINLLSTSVADARNLRIRIASPDVFNRVGIDRPAFLNSIRFNTTVKNGRPVILVSSNQPIHEPFLNFLLEVSWPNGQLLKEYTVLLDPPVLMRPDTAIASNTAGVRAEPRAQGRITRPVVQRQQPRRATQPRRVVRAAAPRRAPARRVAPQRRVAAAPQRASSYRVRRGDTLTKIAGKLGYRGVRSEQMMVALFAKNRRAFSRNNMNNLKAGVVLRRPSIQEARAFSSKQAKSQIIAQAREWKKSRATALAKNNAKNGIKVATNNQARITVSGNNNSVDSNAQSGKSGNAQSAELRKQLTMINESLTTKKKENEELKSRVSELESLLRKKNRLITLKSEQLTLLQERMGVTGGQAPANNSVEPEVQINQNNGTNIQQQVANETANDNGEIIRTNPDLAMANGSQPIVAPEPIVNTQPDPVATPVTNQEDPFVKKDTDESMDIMGLLGSPLAMGVGGGSLLALLGGLWFMRRRKKNQYEDFEFSGENAINIDDAEEVTTSFDDTDLGSTTHTNTMSDDTFEVDESEFVEHDEMRQEHVKNSGLLTDDQEDLLQEADVYIVYGLHDQAESELKQAIDKEPTNLAYRAKLLENYKAAGNKDAFEIEAKAFMQLEVEGKEKYLDDISEWGLALAPESKLFTNDGLKAAATASGVAMVAGTAVAKANEGDVEQDLDSLLDDEFADEQLIDDDFDSIDLDNILTEESEELEDSLESFDTDLDLDLDDISSVGEVQQEFSDNLADDDLDISLDDTKADISALESDLGNDIDLSGGIEFDENFEFDSELDELTDSLETGSDSSLDLDNVLEADNPPAQAGRLDLDSLEDNNLDVTSLNLDLDSDDVNKIMPNDHQYKAAAVDGLSDDKVEDNLLADFDDNLSFLDLDNDDSNAIEETQIDTKIDLAKAYIDMGDIDGARSTLEEVMLEGSEDQKKEAEDLLHQTG